VNAEDRKFVDEIKCLITGITPLAELTTLEAVIALTRLTLIIEAQEREIDALGDKSSAQMFAKKSDETYKIADDFLIKRDRLLTNRKGNDDDAK
jgi:hypothetical protein